MMKCRVRDAECNSDFTAEFDGKLNADAARLTQTVIDMLDLQMELQSEVLVSDEMKDGKRILTWNWKDGTPMPIKFEFTE